MATPEQAQAYLEMVRSVALILPEVEEGLAYGTKAWRVKKKFLARIREDGETLVMRVEPLQRDMLMNAEDGTGAYGANIVTCKDRFKFFEVSKLAAGPRPATVIVDTTYADAELITTVCAKGFPKPEEATGWLAQGDAYVPAGRERTGKFVIDLVTRKIAPQ